MRPPSIQRFEKAFLASIILGLVNAALSWGTLSQTLNDPAVQAAGLGSGFLIGSMVVSTLVSLLLWYFIARKASKVAKWIFVLLLALSIAALASSLADPAAPQGLAMIVAVVSMLLQIYAAWQLFKPDAKAWLDSRGTSGTADPAVFD